MQVFISWSGARSKAAATHLSDWLPLVINAVQPWLSEEIEKGRTWGPQLAERLEQSRIGVFCLTPENLNAPWLLFEAGAISKAKDAHVCTLLLGLKQSEVVPPLGQFQHTAIEQSDVWRLVQTINRAVGEAGERGLDDKRLELAFKKHWSDLGDPLRKIVEQGAEGLPAAPEARRAGASACSAASRPQAPVRDRRPLLRSR